MGLVLLEVEDEVEETGADDGGEEAPAPAEGLPEDWLSGIQEQIAQEPDELPEPMAATEEIYPSEEPVAAMEDALAPAVMEETPVPDWLVEEELPSIG